MIQNSSSRRDRRQLNDGAFIVAAHKIAIVIIAAIMLSQMDKPLLATHKRVPTQETQAQKVAAALQANTEALRRYTWQEKMQLQLKGEVKKVTVNQVSYDANGNEQKMLLSEQPSPDSSQPSGGRLKQRIVEKKTDEFKSMMQDISALVKSYTQLPPDQLKSALGQAKFQDGQGDMAGSVQITMAGVLQTGDSLTFWVDKNALLFRRIDISTTYENNPVTLRANYAMLPSGVVYMAQAILNYPKKSVVVEIDNGSYQPTR